MRVLVTGATGYVGGRLLQRLLERNDLTIRVLVRDAERARGRGWPMGRLHALPRMMPVMAPANSKVT